MSELRKSSTWLVIKAEGLVARQHNPAYPAHIKDLRELEWVVWRFKRDGRTHSWPVRERLESGTHQRGAGSCIQGSQGRFMLSCRYWAAFPEVCWHDRR